MEAGAVLCHRGRVLVPTVMNEAWRTFCRPGTNFIEHYEYRGTSLIGAANLSPVTKLFEGNGAVSRYNLFRSQKTITVQEFNCEQMRVSGCKNNYEFVLSAGAKAKSVTNNLPLLSVLGNVFFVNHHLSLSSGFPFMASFKLRIIDVTVEIVCDLIPFQFLIPIDIIPPPGSFKVKSPGVAIFVVPASCQKSVNVYLYLPSFT